MTKHRVMQGECLSSIAARHGLTWRQLWEAPGNEALRARRKDPHVLHPGDEVAIPDAKERPSVPLELDAETSVVRCKAGHRPLELRVLDAVGEPLRETGWSLTPTGGSALTGATDAGGVLRTELPVEVQAATLEVGELRFDLDFGHLNPLEETDDGGVSGAQARLRNLGYRTGEIDGLFGPVTARALRAFQRDEGLPVTGELDADTRVRLRARHGS